MGWLSIFGHRYVAKCVLAASLLVNCWDGPCGGAAQAALPASAYGGLPNLAKVRLSPDGTHYAAVQSFNGKQVLVVYDLYGPPGKNAKLMALEGNKDLEETLEGFFWANNDRIITVYRFPSSRYGVDTIETRMVSVTRDLADAKQVPRKKNRSASKSGSTTAVAQIQSRVISRLPEDPDHILVALDREGRGQELNAYDMDVETGSLKIRVSGHSSVMGYEADRRGDISLRYVYHHYDETFGVEVYDPEDRKWLANEILSDRSRIEDIVGFSNNPEDVFVTTYGKRGLRQLRAYSLSRNELGKVVFSQPSVDFAGLAVSDGGERVVGYQYTDDFDRTEYIDPEYMSVHTVVSGKLPGHVIELVSRDAQGDKWIIYADGVRHVPKFYIYIRSTGQLILIGATYAKVADKDVMEVKSVSYKARDGLKIPAYVTLPRGAGPFPAVVLPHGGPDARDDMSFDYLAQFLASRGYVVLQPNFRGSEGYGEEFHAAGQHEWGLKMQDDVTDGTQWLISAGYADPSRICIVGASYGGYAALMGVVREPELYKCAVSIAPVTDIQKFLREKSVYKFLTRNDPRIGDSWNDRGRIRDISPANNADRIKASVLLIHGEDDRTVSVDHSRIMAKRLKSAGRSYRFVELQAGDHYFSLQENRVRMVEETGAFLATYLGEN